MKVAKFGGTSLANAFQIKKVCDIVLDDPERKIVVVSAPGDTTDDLITRCEEITADPDPREMDMLLATGEQMSISLLAMAIQSMGHKAVSLTGFQAGISTDDDYTRARVKKINPKIMKI